MMLRILKVTHKPRKCARCGSEVYKILYGMPCFPEDEYFRRYGEHVIYGGCKISAKSPQWECSECEQQYQKIGLHLVKM